MRKLPAVLSRALTDAETVISTLIREDLGASLDASVFGNAASSSSRPAGLLNGLGAIAAASAGADAMFTDLEHLASAITDAGGSSVIFIASPKQTISARLRLRNENIRQSVRPCPHWLQVP